MTERETIWDELDDSSGHPLLPGQLNDELNESEAIANFVSQIYAEGVTEKIISMCEERKPVGKLVDLLPAIRREGDKLIVPVVVEKMVLVKKLVLVEEIILCPDTSTDDPLDTDCDC